MFRLAVAIIAFAGFLALNQAKTVGPDIFEVKPCKGVSGESQWLKLPQSWRGAF